MSADCTLQEQSPAGTKCKVEDGVCKKCGPKEGAVAAGGTWAGATGAGPTEQGGYGTPPPGQDGSVNHWRHKRDTRASSLSRRQPQYPDLNQGAEQVASEAAAAGAGVSQADPKSYENLTPQNASTQDVPGLDSGIGKSTCGSLM